MRTRVPPAVRGARHPRPPVAPGAYDPRMPWARRRYRKNKVYVEVDEADALVLDERGFAHVRYKPDDDRTYTARPAEIGPVGDAAPVSAEPVLDAPRKPAVPGAAAPAAPRRPRKKAAPRTPAVSAEAPAADSPRADAEPPRPSPEEISEGPGDDVPALAGLAVHAYTDGASLGNPGPAGAGVVLLFREHRKEASIYLGVTTNNVAELTGVLEALRLVKRRDLPVRVHTDSTYAIGVLDGSYRPKANRELVARIHAEMQGFTDLRFVKVEGHAGVEWNERADALAGQAAKSKRSVTTSN